MSTKRKTPIVDETEWPNDDEQDGVPRRRSQRLRSSRAKSVSTTTERPGNAKTQSGQGKNTTTRISGDAVALEPSPNIKPQDGVGTPENVRRAIRDLSQLEAKFHRQIRQQKQDIAESQLTVAVDTPEGGLGEEIRKVSGRELGLGSSGRKHHGGTGKRIEHTPEFDGQYLEPWNGRLGYACLNTYLRSANPPVFCSRTCRLATIQARSHPLTDPDQSFHPTKNPPDTSKPADPALGRAYVQSLGLANARDIVPMMRWNTQYGIHFMRLSSEIFPFASHEEQGYDLDFAADVLADAGRVAAELDHRLTTHPGQYTQLGSPRNEVVRAAVRELEYHDQMLELLKLPEQMDRDAVMVIHMGGTFGDKQATLDRFAAAYDALRPSVKKRLVLENDDVCWSVLDLLPTCEQLNIPLTLDWHHHTITYDESMTGSYEELVPLLPRIAKTWERKRITQKMHWSESAHTKMPDGSDAIPRERRKHSARVMRLPPWRSHERVDMCIEAKDKEQAVFELMKRFKGKGWAWDGVGDVIPHLRGEGLGVVRKRADSEDGAEDWDEHVVDEEHGEAALDVGGVNKRVYWPEGKEEWLRPKKRVRRAKKSED